MKTSELFQKALSLTFIVMIAGLLPLSAQTMKVKGRIISSDDSSAIVGATVIDQHTQKGAISGSKGEYTIETRQGNTLAFYFIGYQKKQVRVSSPTINIVLHPGNTELEESIIVGNSPKKVSHRAGAAAVNTADMDMGYGMDMEYGAEPMVMTYSRSYPKMPEKNNEEYRKFTPNGFMAVMEQPLSTFSIDVDAASFSNMRRFINNGILPPANAIRTEELINYFTYNYPQPTGSDPVSITTEAAGCPWNKEHRLVRIGLKTKDIDRNSLPASNLVFLIDVSGSMDEPNKLPLLKSSLRLLVSQLRNNDRVAIVTYAGNAETRLPSTSGKEKAKIIAAIEQLEAGGVTYGESGIRTAYQTARQNFIKTGNNRVILATDGDFNVGISKEDELGNLIEQERRSGIFLTVLGFGMGNYKDNRMQVLAQKGNGNHAYIDNLTEARKVLVNEFGGTLFTVAKDVKLQIEFNPAKVQSYRLIGYETRLLRKEDFNDDTKDAGEMGAGHTVTALYEVIPAGAKGLTDPLKYQKTASPAPLTNSPELLTVKLRYKHPDSDQSSKMEKTVIDRQGALAQSSPDFRFAAAVAGFGMLLNQSPHLGNLSVGEIINLARQSTGNDPEGYRNEFIRLAECAALLMDKQEY